MGVVMLLVVVCLALFHGGYSVCPCTQTIGANTYCLDFGDISGTEVGQSSVSYRFNLCRPFNISTCNTCVEGTLGNAFQFTTFGSCYNIGVNPTITSLGDGITVSMALDYPDCYCKGGFPRITTFTILCQPGAYTTNITINETYYAPCHYFSTFYHQYACANYSFTPTSTTATATSTTATTSTGSSTSTTTSSPTLQPTPNPPTSTPKPSTSTGPLVSSIGVLTLVCIVVACLN